MGVVILMRVGGFELGIWYIWISGVVSVLIEWNFLLRVVVIEMYVIYV